MGLRQLTKRAINWVMADIPIRENQYTVGKSPYQSTLDDTEKKAVITMYSAVGGKVIQVTNHDQRDHRQTTLYIIADNENLGEQIGMILTSNSLSR